MSVLAAGICSRKVNLSFKQDLTFSKKRLKLGVTRINVYDTFKVVRDQKDWPDGRILKRILITDVYANKSIFKEPSPLQQAS